MGLCVLFLFSFSSASFAVELKGDPNKVPPELEGVGVTEHLGEKLDLDQMTFIDSQDGKSHTLKELTNNGKPTLLNLVYFECPMLCTMVLNGVTDGLKKLDWSVGKEFNMLTISIDPKDTPDLGEAKRDVYLKHYFESENGIKRDEALVASGWKFMTGSEAQIKKLAAALGFQYKYDEVQQQYAHSAVTFVLTPEGMISRYLYGIQYQPRDLRLALLEASRGKIGSVFDRILMFCYHYEPSARGYALQAVRVMQLAALATMAVLFGYLTVFWTRHFSQRQRKGKLK